MLTFEQSLYTAGYTNPPRPEYLIIDCAGADIGSIQKFGTDWCLQRLDVTAINSDELRQIAAKLDELNGKGEEG